MLGMMVSTLTHSGQSSVGEEKKRDYKHDTVKPFNLAAKIYGVFSHTDNLASIKFSVLTFIDNKLLLFIKLLTSNLAFKIFWPNIMAR